MKQYFELVKRNVRVYIRDKGSVFFSLMTMLIVLALMLFFLGDMNIDSLTECFENLPDRDAAADAANAKLFVTLWTCAGIISINAVTVTLAVYSTMIKDRTERRLCAIYTAPVSRLSISAAYITSAWISSVIICVLTLAISEIYCIIQGGEVFSALAHFQLIGMIAVNSFTYAALMYLAAVLVKTQGAWSGLGTVVGTLVGFLGGIYIPIGSFAEEIATVLKFTPVMYGTKVFRSIMTRDICTELFSGAPEALRSEYLEYMGVQLDFMGMEVSSAACVVLMLACGVVFLAAGAFATKYASATE